MRRMLRILICLMMVPMLSAIGESSEQGRLIHSGDYVYWLDSSNGAAISLYSGSDAELDVPSSIDGHPVNVIERFAFMYNDNLITVTLPDAIKTIGYNPFFLCKNLVSIYTNSDDPLFTQIDGVLFNKVEKKLISYPAGKKDTSYSAPDGLLFIGNLAFSNCPNLTSITLPIGLVSIDTKAFAQCENLTSITLPASITSIGMDAFDKGTTLTVQRGSYAEKWADENGFKYQYSDSSD